jgi:hypothetical protein
VSLRVAPPKVTVMQIIESEQEKKLTPSTEYTSTSIETHQQISIPEPVYLSRNESGEECIVYNSFVMELGKRYPVKYKGEKWILVKTGTGVDFMKFHADK